jgi:hypothetical protein
MEHQKQIYCSRDEAAELCRCSTKTIDRRVRDGFLVARKLHSSKGGRVLILIESITIPNDELIN